MYLTRVIEPPIRCCGYRARTHGTHPLSLPLSLAHGTGHTINEGPHDGGAVCGHIEGVDGGHLQRGGGHAGAQRLPQTETTYP